MSYEYIHPLDLAGNVHLAEFKNLSEVERNDLVTHDTGNLMGHIVSATLGNSLVRTTKEGILYNASLMTIGRTTNPLRRMDIYDWQLRASAEIVRREGIERFQRYRSFSEALPKIPAVIELKEMLMSSAGFLHNPTEDALINMQRKEVELLLLARAYGVKNVVGGTLKYNYTIGTAILNLINNAVHHGQNAENVAITAAPDIVTVFNPTKYPLDPDELVFKHKKGERRTYGVAIANMYASLDGWNLRYERVPLEVGTGILAVVESSV